MTNDANSLVDNLSSNIIALEGGDTYQVTRIKDHKHRIAPYFCIGRKGHTAYFDPITKQKTFTEGFDSVNTFIQLSPITLALFWKLVSLRDTRTNTIDVTQSGLSDTDKNRLKKGVRELLNHQLVCRIKRGYLLINPKAILPDHKFYESVELRWDQLIIQSSKPDCSVPVSDNFDSIEILKSRLPTSGMMATPIEFDDEDDTASKPTSPTIKRTLTL